MLPFVKIPVSMIPPQVLLTIQINKHVDPAKYQTSNLGKFCKNGFNNFVIDSDDSDNDVDYVPNDYDDEGDDDDGDGNGNDDNLSQNEKYYVL